MSEEERLLIFGEIMKNQDIVARLSQVKLKEEMQDIFACNGLEISVAETEAFIRAMHLEELDSKEETTASPAAVL